VIPVNRTGDVDHKLVLIFLSVRDNAMHVYVEFLHAGTLLSLQLLLLLLLLLRRLGVKHPRRDRRSD
jgi:hypothetical protein